MHQVEVASATGDYPVVVGRGILTDLAQRLAEVEVGAPWAVVSNATVSPLYGAAAAAVLGAAPPLELPDGESFKTLDGLAAVCRFLVAEGLHRGGTVVAVGGGVVTDLAGFAAAVYLRGVRWVAVPTTLLAMVDAAVGGKTGANLAEGKNLVGVFWPPRLVVADVMTLATLPPRQLRAGLAEVVKVAWLGDQGLLELLEEPLARFSDRTPEAWERLVLRAIGVKVGVVAADEREQGARQALNFGHTVGHALEAAMGYGRLLHGEAVAWGMLAEARVARQRGLLGDEGWRRLRRAVAALGPLPELGTVSMGRIFEHLDRDKKRDGSGVAWVLPTDDGVKLGQRVTAGEVQEALAWLLAGAA